MLSQHIIRKAALEDENDSRWYDNPDLSDLLFATFNNDEFRDHTVCLDTYRPGVGGFVKTQLQTGDFQSNFVSADQQPLQDKIVYKSILTISTTDPAAIKAKLDSVLDGIDNGVDGMPKLILIPVLMHHNHFGIFAIEPNANPAQTKVSYFNPKGSMRELGGEIAGYADEEGPMLDYMRDRYPDATVQHNTTEEVYQLDGDSCGPIITQFAINTARTAITGQSPADQFNATNKHCGMQAQTVIGQDSNTGRNIYSSTLPMRQEQAQNLDPSLKCNYSFWLFKQAQDVLDRVVRGTRYAADSVHILLHKGIQASAHVTMTSANNKPIINGQQQVMLGRLDIFEMQPATVDAYVAQYGAGTALSNPGLGMDAPDASKNANIKIAAVVITAVLALAGAGVGISYGLGAF